MSTFVSRRVLLVEDDEELRFAYAAHLKASGFLVEEAGDLPAAQKSFESTRPDVAVLDFRLPGGTALDLLPKFKELEPGVPIIVLTGFGSMELGVSLIRSGAEQCLAKPVEASALLMIVHKLLENSRNQQKTLANNTRRRRVVLNPFTGESLAIRRLAETAAKVANSQSPVLIQGETGCGKGVLATWLHENGPRSEEPFIDLNCAGLTREFLESELFGYERGAFTGAVTPKPGLLEVGHRGTIFLDEIGDIDPNVQPKLLKVIEEKRFRRMGDVRDRFIDVRLIAATHQDLRHLIETKVFRSDLYFRISTVPLAIPSLRERRDDIPAIAQSLLLRICSDMARPPAQISPKAVDRLRSYYWPGNIRELRNVLERALLFTDRAILEPEDFSFEPGPDHRSNSYKLEWTLEEVERFHITSAFTAENHNVEKTAKRLGIAKSTLYQKLKTLHLI
ncbi:MAG: sigma-54-dependent Fis family transcriptional regulator [Acidobacteria bacterium]|nr:MAG: sigma-54-dependent Fis family transcriptional regulator [Acidobacteriota bacterium]